MTHHLACTPATLTRAGSAVAVAAIAALTLALPANAQRPPEPDPGLAPAASAVVLATPAALPDGGIQILQVGAGLLAGVGIGAAAVAAARNRRAVQHPSAA